MAADASILPSSEQTLSQLTQLFISRGLSQSDMIILSGNKQYFYIEFVWN